MAFHRKIALIGLGAITNHILSTLQAQNELHRVSGILDRPGRARILRTYEYPVRVVDDLGALLGMQPDIVMGSANMGNDPAKRNGSRGSVSWSFGG